MDSAGHSAPDRDLAAAVMAVDQFIVWAWVVLSVLTLVYFLRRRSARRGFPSQLTQQPQQQRNGSWSTGLYGGWSGLLPQWSSCLPSLLFPAAQVALNTAELEGREPEVADLCANCLWGAQVSAYRNRRLLRDQLSLPLQPCEDLLAVLCCPCCVVAQHTRELEHSRAAAGLPAQAAVEDEEGISTAPGPWGTGLQYTPLRQATLHLKPQPPTKGLDLV